MLWWRFSLHLVRMSKKVRMFTTSEVRVGSPLSHARLSVFPLYTDQPTPASYRLAGPALADGTVVVEEATEGGNVPRLAVENKGDRPVLFIEGEELRGAKQNRVLNTSVLIGAGVRTVLPVSCVEQGRWRYTSKHFSPSQTGSSAKLRGVLKSSVSGSAKAGRGHGSDQSGVWSEVSRQMSSHGTSSATMAMSDTFTAAKKAVDEHLSHVGYPEGASGLAVAVGGKVVLVDLFDCPNTCREVWPRLLSGATMDALEADDAPAPTETEVRDAITAFRARGWEAVPAAGLGEEYRGEPDGKWHGSVLAKDGVVIHASLVTSS